MKKQKQAKPYPVRMPIKLKEWVIKRAEQNKRSINSEINFLIELAVKNLEKQELASNEQS